MNKVDDPVGMNAAHSNTQSSITASEQVAADTAKKCSDNNQNPGCRKSSGTLDGDRSIGKYKHHRGADLHDIVFRLSAKVEISD
jgi:hypothetical protein